MIKPFVLFAAMLSICCWAPEVTAGNLSIIEKRLVELDKLNRQAIEQVGEIPQNGSVEIEAKATPGDIISKEDPELPGKSYDFTKKNVLALNEKTPYTVQISASRSQQQCYRVAAMLRRTGYPAFTATIALKDQGIWHRIFVGSFASESDAQKTRESLEKDEITETIVRNMPYAIQVGDSGSLESFKELRDKLVSLQHMPYTSYVRDVNTTAPHIRLLLGAFETKEDTTTLVNILRAQGLTARVVNR